MTDHELSWLNPPPFDDRDGGEIRVRTGARTDFWRETFYGFWRDNGHFLFLPVEGDFSAEVTVRGRYEVLYDQAGLMARLSETHWVKCGVEFTNGEMLFSVVVTNNASDWSLIKIPFSGTGVRVRLTRHREAIRVQYLDAPDGRWKMARLGYLPPSCSIDIGMMCCSPEREGFEVTFADFTIGPPVARQLHD